MNDRPLVRPARAADLPAIRDIYAPYVTNSTCTFQTEPETLADRQAWFAAHDARHPVVVAEQAGAVVGWASLSPYHTRCAYRHTVEDSVYVREDVRGRGLGGMLLADLIRRASVLGHHSIIAMIAADQAPSIALHAAMGFTQVAHLREVGYKFERWIDVIFMQRML